METFAQLSGNIQIILENRNSLDCYARWPRPTVIFVDGPYGIGGFPGDPKDTKLLPEVYAPHVAEWSKYAMPDTTLWFWGTELGWARMHPYLEVNGWNYEQTFVWNKGIGHVGLIRKNGRKDILLGIELKSWFILSKEGEPSFRYRTAAEACDYGDLLSIIPWYLSNAVCGHPVFATPWVYSAKAAAEATKRYWLYERATEKPLTLEQRGLEIPAGIKPYMVNARDKTNYKPVNDGGNNFGRLARTGVMSDFVKETLSTDILGIPADNWRLFLKAHTDSSALKEIQKKIGTIARIPQSEEFDRLMKALKDYVEELPAI
ncbi:MAG: hypothetical protein IJR07_06825 [Bacteroidaceae bacterium]|nr:hypothetical protein [Bacteroidaceae bacterium]